MCSRTRPWRPLLLLVCLWLLTVQPYPAQATADVTARGPLLAYTVTDGEQATLVLRRAGGSLYRSAALPAGVGAAAARGLSPDGRWLVYSTGAISLPWEPEQADLVLHLFDVEAGSDRRLIPLVPANFPANIAANAEALIARDPSLTDFENFEEAVYLAFMDGLTHFAWSPNGSTLAFGGAMDGPSTDLYTYAPAADALVRLTDGIEQINDIRWSPDGRWIWHNTISFGYCASCDGHKYAAAADGSGVLTLHGDEIDRHLGWAGPTTYLETDQANGPGDFDLRLVDLDGPEVRTLWPGRHDAFALDLAGQRLAVSGALTYTRWVDSSIFVVDLAAGEHREVADPAALDDVAADLLAALDQAGGYPCDKLDIIVRPCSDLPGSPNSPDGQAAAGDDGGLYAEDGSALLPPAAQVAGGTVLWRPDGEGYFVVKAGTLFYRSRSDGAIQKLDEGVQGVRWLEATEVPVAPGAEEAEVAPTPVPVPTPYLPLIGTPRDRAAVLAERQARELAALATDPPMPFLAYAAEDGLPLLLAREAVHTTQRQYVDLFPLPYVLPEAETALRQVVAQAPPWRATFPAGGPLPSPYSMALSADGAWVATGHADGSVRLWEWASGRLARTLTAETQGIPEIAFSPDGHYLAAAAYSSIVHVWNMQTGRLATHVAGRVTEPFTMAWAADSTTLLVSHGDGPVLSVRVSGGREPLIDGAAEAMAYSPDGTRLAIALRRVYPRTIGAGPGPTVASDSPISLRDVATGQEIARLPDEGWTEILGFTPDSAYLVSVNWPALRIFDAATGALEQTVKLPDSPNGWTFTPDGKQFVMIARRTGVTFWDLATGAYVRSLPVNADTLSGLAIHPETGELVSTDISGRPLVLDAETGAVTPRFDSPSAQGVLMHPTRPLVASFSESWVDLRDLDTGQVVRRLAGLPAQITAFGLTADGAQLYAADWGGNVVGWDVETGEQVAQFSTGSETIRDLSAEAPGYLVTLIRQNALVVWELPSLVEHWRLEPGGKVFAMDASPTGQVAAALEDGTIQIVDLAARATRGTLRGIEREVVSMRFSPDGATLAATTIDGHILLWDAASGDLRTTLDLGEFVLGLGLAFRRDGQTLATAATDSTPLTLWDVATGARLRTLPTYAQGDAVVADALAFTPDGSRLAAADIDSMVRVYGLTPTRQLRSLTGHAGSVWEAAFSPGGELLVTAGEDRTVRLWEWQTGAEFFRFEPQPDRVFTVDFSPTRDGVLMAGYGGEIRVYDPAVRRLKAMLSGHSGWVETARFAPDGVMIASAGSDRTVRLWNSTTGAELWRKTDLPPGTKALAFSPDGLLLAAAAGAGEMATIYLWETATGAEVKTLRGHTGYISALAFSPGGTRLASASWDYTAKLWDVGRGVELATFSGHRDILTDLAFHPGGTRLATLAEDYTLRLWNLASGEQTDQIDLPRSLAWSVAFHPDGRALVTTHWDGVVRTWLTDPDSDSLPVIDLRAGALTPRVTAQFTMAERRGYGIDTYIGGYPLSASGDVNLRAEPYVRSLVVYPGTPEQLWALTDEALLLRSQDRGDTWQVMARLPLSLTVNSLGIPARADDPLLLATRQGLYRYGADGRVTLVNSQGFAGVSFSPTAPGELWGVSEAKVYKSENGGASWGEASNDLNAYRLTVPLLLTQPNNNPQFVAGSTENEPGIRIWRGAGNGFWKRLPNLPVQPGALVGAPGMAWDGGARTLYLGDADGRLWASTNSGEPVESAVTASAVYDFGLEGRPMPLAVGQDGSLYVTLFTSFSRQLLRGTWDGSAWQWVDLFLPMQARG